MTIQSVWRGTLSHRATAITVSRLIVRYLDEKQQRYFYVNQVTGTRTWQKPVRQHSSVYSVPTPLTRM